MGIQFAGSVSPFRKDLNAGSPSTYKAYSRNWEMSGLTPKPGDDILLKSSKDKDWVRFRISKFCGWEQKKCGSATSHVQIANGQTYNSKGQSLPGFVYFNGCARDGGCNSKGVDGVAFAKNSGWAHGPAGCYGGCWTNDDGAFYWGTSIIDTTMTYWYRQ